VERGQHSVDRDLGGIDVESTELNRFVGGDDDLLVELGNPTQFGVAFDRVPLAGECNVALSEF